MIIKTKLNDLYTWVRKNIILISVLLVIFLVILILNIRTLYAADDYVYKFVYLRSWPLPHLQKITTSMIPYSMWNHYFWWNGRFVAHSIVQYFMQFNTKIPFDICNSIAFVGLIFMINRFATKFSKKKLNVWMIPLIFFFLWFFVPYFGQVFLWLSGSGNYLWMSLIYLGFIFLNLKKLPFNWKNGLAFGIVGFLAGATNENSGPAAVLIILLFMIQRLIKEHKVSLNSVISVIFSGIGFLVMLLSPGSQKRGTMTRTWEHISQNFDKIATQANERFTIVYIVIVALIVILFLLKQLTVSTFTSVVFFMIGHFAAIYSMAFSPDYPIRTFFGGAVFMGIALFILLYSLLGSYQRITAVIVIPLVIMWAGSYINAYHSISMSRSEVLEQYRVIQESKKHDPSIAHIKILTPTTNEYNPYDDTAALLRNPKEWMNLWEAKYFGVDKIIGK